jgi:membrane-associated phospholipid phosphatase
VLIVGYWLPARIAAPVDLSAEQALLAFDRRWAGWLAVAPRAPRVIREAIELMYLLCYPIIPGGLALLATQGFSEEADRYWTALMTAGALCYGTLPWLATRPPRAIEAQPARPARGVRRLNLALLDRASVQLNTCPSGHVATSVAAALVVGARVFDGGVLFATLALLIACASVAGRYHYAIDAVAGVLVGILAFAVSRWV